MANPVDRYRSTHLQIRKILTPYTARLCPKCAEPCCRKPTKVREFDVLIANACGCSLPSANESVTEMVNAGMQSIAGGSCEKDEMEPCDYLGEKGCLFPDDLRPFECTRWMCSFLRREMKPGDMRQIRDLLHKLGVLHRTILDATDPRRSGR